MTGTPPNVGVRANRAAPGVLPRLFPLLPASSFDPSLLAAVGDAMGRTRVAGAGRIGSGYVYFGQFITHDVTNIVVASPDRAHGDPGAPHQLSTPMLDLSNVYGAAGFDAVELVDPGTGEMRLSRVLDRHVRTREADLPRDAAQQALVGDERDDENLLVAQFHVQFLKLHNYFVQELRRVDASMTPRDLFEEARRQTVLHYQELVLCDFLHTVIDPMVWSVVVAPEVGAAPPRPPALASIWTFTQAFVPVEFAGAAFRFGHSMVRPRYALHSTQGVELETLFRMTGRVRSGGELFKLNGLPASHVVEWSAFFGEDGRPPANVALPIDVHVALPLPPGVTPLATRDLTTGHTLRLPDGQSVVAHLQRAHAALVSRIGLRALTPAELLLPGLDPQIQQALIDSTPLWYYILAEANAVHRGYRLGPLGSLLVAETLCGLAQLSVPSVVNGRFQAWRIAPTKTINGRNYLGMTDVLRVLRGRTS